MISFVELLKKERTKKRKKERKKKRKKEGKKEVKRLIFPLKIFVLFEMRYDS